MRLIYLPLLSLLLLPAVASAGLVQPGESTLLNSSDFVLPAGSMVDSMTTPFTLDYGPADAVSGFDGTLRGSLYSAVYNVGGKLAFLYDVNLDPTNVVSGAIEQSDLRVSSFSGFTTFVTGALDYEEIIQANRSADGSIVGLRSDTPGLGGPPILLIQTNATAYDKAGQANFLAADEFPMLDMTGELLRGETTVAGALRPVDEGKPHAIPLPPAAYSGLGVLLVMGLLKAGRRVQNVKVC